MFEPLPSKFDFPAAERRILEFWDRERVFERSLELRANAPRFVFYEGPPTANGLPHPGHCLTRAMKDIFPRYRTMTGHLVERKAGWDTHGLPVEREVEKELIAAGEMEAGGGKAGIEQYGVEKFNLKCIRSVFRYTREWEDMTRRLGFWVNLKDAYVTYHQSYVESVWWSLKTLFERGLLYQAHKVVWWWAQGGTALSAGEVGEGYREVDDPSVFVKFPLFPHPPLKDQKPTAPAHANRTSLLVWTTTPWTLISNHFAAVHPDLDYALVHDPAGDEYLYIAAVLVDPIAKKLKRELQVVEQCKGSALIGRAYNPPFDVYSNGFVLYAGDTTLRRNPRVAGTLVEGDTWTHLGNARSPLRDGTDAKIGWRVLAADFVTTESGSGIVHEAPAFGEVDFNLLQDERKRFADPDAIPLLCAVNPDGTFNSDAPEKYRGRWVKDCDKDIIRELRDERKTPWGTPLLYHQEQYRHDYPFCPRAPEDPLIQYARKSWFVRTSQFKDEFLKNNAAVNWLPEHIKEGRFGDFLRNNVDWALSRERYWGTPLPIWQCEKCGKMEAIGSMAELKAQPDAHDRTEGGESYWDTHNAAHGGELPEHLRVHKPYIDAWTYACEACKGSAGVSPARMKRVPEVIDCWWDAGSMPFAQWGFPHKDGSVAHFSQRFPADFISEAIDQTRGWFYGLLSISTLMFAGSAGVPPARRRGVLANPVTDAMTIRKRWKLPHWEAGGSTYFLTYRLLSGTLSEPERDLALAACTHWDEKRMLLHAAVVMPDHVHLLCTPLEREPGSWWSIADLLHSIKGLSAKEINARRGAEGAVWQAEYFDRVIRNESDFAEKWNYVVTNPVRRGLPEDYRWVWVEPAHASRAETPTDAERPCGRDGRTPQYPLPFRTCIVLGHMMGEDGNKMSKRLRNYKEPSYIFDTFGADAMRWYFFSAQAPWTTTRFTEANIRDSQREFLVKLYNVLSFFTIYASIDGFDPRRRDEPGNPMGYRPSAERTELDRWIITELHRTVRNVRESMDRFENYPAAQKLGDFVDALSNWYVRRSRDRFWRREKDQPKWDAYHTLYGCLRTLSRLIAPFTPFFAETMHIHLRIPGDPGSVHLCDYPRAGDIGYADEPLADMMDTVRELVALGRGARAGAKLKVRQPLALVEIVLADTARRDDLAAHAALIAEELNVKRVEFTTEADHYVSYKVVPNFKAIGAKFRALVPKLKSALEALPDAAAARRQLIDEGGLPLTIDGQEVRLTPDEVEIRLEARPGWSAAQGRAGVVVVSTEITPELRDEGVIRELIHHVQAQRKELNLAYEARIRLHITGPAEFLAILRRLGDVVRAECLATEIIESLPAGVGPLDLSVEGHGVKLAVVAA